MSEQHYFGDISISSLASNDGNDNSEMGSIHTVELYQRLQDLEEMTANYLTVRPLQLTTENDSYADIEPGGFQDFEFKVGVFSKGDVLALTVSCLPSCTVDDIENFIDESARAPVDHHPLDISLRLKRSSGKLFVKETAFKPSVHNSEFSFVLTVAHGLTAGSALVLTVKNLAASEGDKVPIGAKLQAIRVSIKHHSQVRSVPLENGRPMTGRTLSGEFSYFRFVCQDRSRLVSVRVKPLYDENGPIGDPDLYITNKYDGLVAVTKENCIWKSVNAGPDRIDIHPADPNAARGGTFMIGVMGYKEVNDFEIIAVMTEPEPIISIAPGQQFDFPLQAGRYSYYSLKLDPRSRGKVLLTISAGSTSVMDSLTSTNMHASAVNAYKAATSRAAQKYGRGVYAADELASHGLMPDICGGIGTCSGDARQAQEESVGGAGTTVTGVTSLLTAAALTSVPGGVSFADGLGAQDPFLSPNAAAARMMSIHSAPYTGGPADGTYSVYSMTNSNFAEIEGGFRHTFTLPMSYCLKAGLFPVLYASSTCLYPSAHDYLWRASGVDGVVSAVIEADEWKHSACTCFISVFALDLDQLPHGAYTLPSEADPDLCYGRDEGSSKDPSRKFRDMPSSQPSTTTSMRVVDPSAGTSLGRKMRETTCKMTVQLLDEADALNPGELARFKLFKLIYHDIDGAGISNRERARLYPDDKENHLTYGEIEYLSFQELLRNAGACDGQIFYDLGCGTGKALLSAALSGIKFIKCVGIELLPALFECANNAIDEINTCINDSDAPGYGTTSSGGEGRGVRGTTAANAALNDDDERSAHVTFYTHSVADDRDAFTGAGAAMSSSAPGVMSTAASEFGYNGLLEQKSRLSTLAANSLRAGLPLLEVREGDFLCEDWSEADILFAASLCYSDETMAAIIDSGRQLRPGARIITLKLPPRVTSVFDGVAGQALFAAAPGPVSGEPAWMGLEGDGNALLDGVDISSWAAAGLGRTMEGYERYFDLECTTWCKMTWGRAKVYVLKRKTDFAAQNPFQPASTRGASYQRIQSVNQSYRSRTEGYHSHTRHRSRERADSGDWETVSQASRSVASGVSRSVVSTITRSATGSAAVVGVGGSRLRNNFEEVDMSYMAQGSRYLEEFLGQSMKSEE